MKRRETKEQFKRSSSSVRLRLALDIALHLDHEIIRLSVLCSEDRSGMRVIVNNSSHKSQRQC